jgi:hypothetical protein
MDPFPYTIHRCYTSYRGYTNNTYYRDYTNYTCYRGYTYFSSSIQCHIPSCDRESAISFGVCTPCRGYFPARSAKFTARQSFPRMDSVSFILYTICVQRTGLLAGLARNMTSALVASQLFDRTLQLTSTGSLPQLWRKKKKRLVYCT